MKGGRSIGNDGTVRVIVLLASASLASYMGFVAHVRVLAGLGV